MYVCLLFILNRKKDKGHKSRGNSAFIINDLKVCDIYLLGNSVAWGKIIAIDIRVLKDIFLVC